MELGKHQKHPKRWAGAVHLRRKEPKLVKPPTRSWWLDGEAFYEIAHEEAKRMSGER